MPIYEFQCNQCGHRFDHLQKLSDTDPVICPACETPNLYRRVSAPSFRLAGSGWYETDFKKDSDKKRNLADGGGSDAKPAPGDSAASTPAAAPTPTPAPAPAPTPNSAPAPAPAPAKSGPGSSGD